MQVCVMSPKLTCDNLCVCVCLCVCVFISWQGLVFRVSITVRHLDVMAQVRG